MADAMVSMVMGMMMMLLLGRAKKLHKQYRKAGIVNEKSTVLRVCFSALLLLVDIAVCDFRKIRSH